MEKTHANTNTEKLVPHLFKHENYVLRYRNLKFCHDLGIQIALKRVISFKQSTWLVDYINSNNRLPPEAKANGDEFLVSVSERRWKMLETGKHARDYRQRQRNKVVQ